MLLAFAFSQLLITVSNLLQPHLNSNSFSAGYYLHLIKITIMALEFVKNKKVPSKSEIKGRLIFGPIMIVGGIILILFATMPKLEKAKETKSWPTTQGKVTSTWITAHKDGHDKRNRAHMEHYSSDEGNKFRVDFIYEYTVNNENYSCSKRDLMQSKKEGYGKYRRATRKMNQLQNSDVLVFYNPNDPNEALLKPGLSALNWLLVVSPIMLILIGLPIAFNGIKHTINPPNYAEQPKAKSFSDNFSKQA